MRTEIEDTLNFEPDPIPGDEPRTDADVAGDDAVRDDQDLNDEDDDLREVRVGDDVREPDPEDDSLWEEDIEQPETVDPELTSGENGFEK